MVHMLSTLAFLAVAACGFGIIVAMIGDNVGAIRQALAGVGEVETARPARPIRVRTRRSAYRVAAHLPAARRAA